MLLSGVRIVSFCHYLQGPAASQYLADLGADVIKIEPVTGAFERKWAGASSYVNGVSSLFLTANRNKRSLAVDLKSPEGRELVLRLIGTAQIVMENFRPGVLDRLGFGYEALREKHPALIYASASGFGSTGPLAENPGQDLLVQARCGLIAGNGDRFGGPKAVGAAVVDQHGGALLALGVLGAYVRLLQTGIGTRVESSLFSAGLDLQAEALTTYYNRKADRSIYKRDSHLGTWFHEAPYGVYRLADGRFIVLSNSASPTMMQSLADALDDDGIREIAHLPRYENRDIIAQTVARALERKTYEEAAEGLAKHKLWFAPVNDFDDLASDPQVAACEVFDKIDIGGETATLVNHPIRYDGAIPQRKRLPIEPGQDTQEVLSELGYSQDEVERLVQSGVIAMPAPSDPNQA